MKKIKQGSLVAFKPKDKDIYYTGYYRDLGKGTYKIDVILPVEPQWIEDGDKTIYFYSEVDDIIMIK